MSKDILDELPDDWRGALEERLDASRITALGELVTKAYREETVYPHGRTCSTPFIATW